MTMLPQEDNVRLVAAAMKAFEITDISSRLKTPSLQKLEGVLSTAVETAYQLMKADE